MPDSIIEVPIGNVCAAIISTVSPPKQGSTSTTDIPSFAVNSVGKSLTPLI